MRLSKRARRRLAALIGLLLVVGAGVVVLRSVREQQTLRISAEKREAGLSAFRDGDYEAALPDLSYALTRDKSDLELLLAFAEARSRIPEVNDRHITEAIGLFNRALQLDPGNTTALTRLLSLYRDPAVARLLELAQTAETILAQDPDNVDALEALASARFTQRRYVDALEAIERLQALEPAEIEWYRFHLGLMIAMGSSEGAILDQCDAWIASSDVEDGRFHFLKAAALADMDRVVESRELALAAAERGASSAAVLRHLIRLLEHLDLNEASNDLLDRAKASFADEAWVWEESIRRSWATRDVEAATAELASAGEALGSLPSSLLKWRALVLILDERSDEARPALEELESAAASSEPAERDALRSWAGAIRAYLQLGESNWSSAKAAFDDAVALNPDDPVLHYMVGEAYQRVREDELASKSFEKAWLGDRNWLTAGLAYADSLIALGRPLEAMRVCGDLRGDRSSMPPQLYFMSVRAWLATCEATGGTEAAARATNLTLDSVIESLESLLLNDRYRHRAEVLSSLFSALELAGDVDAAEGLVQTVVEDPESPVPAILTAAAASRRCGFGYERELLARAQALSPSDAGVVALEATILHDEGRIDEALALLEGQQERAQSVPDRQSFARLRAEILSRVQDERALDALKALLDMQPLAADTPAFILTQRAAWSDEALIARTINRLRSIVGEEGSTRLLLAEATYLLHFDEPTDENLAKVLTKTNTALKNAPDSAAALVLMSDALLAGPKPDERQAIEYLRQALQLYPSRLDLYPKLIALYQKRGQYADAAEYLARLGRRNDLDQSTRRTELALLERQGEFDEAIVRLQALPADETTTTDSLALASLLLRTGRLDEAREVVDALRQADPRNTLAAEMAAEVEALRGDIESGASLLAASVPDEADRLLRLGAFYRRHGALEKAIELHRRAAAIAIDRPAAWNELVTSHLHAGDPSQAVRTVREALAHHPDDASLRASYALASLEGAPSQRSEALRLLRDAPGDHEALIDTLEFYGSMADSGGSAPAPTMLAAAKTLVERHPDFLPAWRLAMGAHVQAGQVDAALSLARDALGRHPDEAAPAEWTTQLLLKQRRLDEALDAARVWRLRSRLDPMRPDILITSILIELGRPEEAAAQIHPHIDRLLAERGTNVHGAAVALEVMVRSGRVGDATRQWSGILRSEAVWRARWLDVAKSAEPEAASEMVESLEGLAPDDAAEHLRIAGAWAAIYRNGGGAAAAERAEQFARRALGRSALEADVHLLLGSLSEAKQDAAAAERHYRAALKVRPDDPIALNNLAYVLLSGGRNVAEAIALAQRAIAIAPDIAALHDTLAAALLAVERSKEAEGAARAALTLAEGVPAYRLTLARTLFAQSRYDEAARELETTLRLIDTASSPDETVRSEARRLHEEIERARSLTQHEDPIRSESR